MGALSDNKKETLKTHGDVVKVMDDVTRVERKTWRKGLPKERKIEWPVPRWNSVAPEFSPFPRYERDKEARKSSWSSEMASYKVTKTMLQVPVEARFVRM